MPVVIDASALVELLLQSERAPAVLQAVGATDMVAPDTINPEVLSTLRRFERIGELRALGVAAGHRLATVRRQRVRTTLPVTLRA